MDGTPKPQTEHRVPVLDGWRGLAILGVVVDHFVSRAGINLGRFGVELFFVLSGRLMAEILFVKRTPLRVFFPRRFSRIYPALLCFATALFVVAKLSGWFDISFPVYLAGLGFTMNYTAIWWDVSAATDHLWSLAIEEHCYILLGLLAALGRWRPALPVWWIIVALVALAMLNGALQTYLGHHRYHNVYWRTDVRGASILISVAFYLWWQRRAIKPGPLASPWTPLACMGLGILFNLNAVPDPVKYSLGTLCLAVAVTTLPQVPRPVARLLESRALTALGVGSFSLYLWQQPFSLIPDPTWRIASLVPVALVAVLSYRLVEQPARRALNRWLSPRPGIAPRPAAILAVDAPAGPCVSSFDARQPQGSALGWKGGRRLLEQNRARLPSASKIQASPDL